MTSTLLKFPRINAPTVHTLPNGLTIVAEQMPVEAVNLSLWIKVGSAVESDAINGMAHFLEHMIFKGTERLASGEFERHIEERGAVTNAATSQDYTQYYINTAPKDFAALAPLQIDVVCNAIIPDDAFERERLVVLEEIRRSEDNPRRRTFRRSMETAFEQLPYRRPVLGPEAVISQLKAQQMRDFHRTWYQPQSITAVAVGNLPVEELIATVAEGFSVSEQLTVNSQQLGVNPEPAFTEVVRREFVDESLQEARLVMVWRVPGLKQLNDIYGLDVLAGVLGHGLTSRLVRDLREERELVTSIGVSNMTNQLQGTFYISAKCAVENLQAVEEAIAQHIRILHTELVSEPEIARVRRRVANKFIFANETPSDRAGLYGYYQSMVGDLEPAFNYPDHIQSQDATDLMQAAQQYLSPDAYGVVVLKPHQ
ncbi:pitrilysin family protein [Nodularia spumigena CS-584]|jgi:zinc protease|uniref:Pitrilysin family protein n=2 Tax=Nodularia spumigena TaxID=70799 RepID=A0ABU5UWN6_NODSP|nr:pitrilysin family protein [Nodularia spumigena]AVZ30512.1 putative zinc protease [Nodularia spumigena UHCC 0039]MDB9384942.1 pitrilysin family protein [Nodularia spumigena CS-584]MEA5527183.1 pitrilysin family protein [Nodularia spumigena UHCC 0143]MEA5557446.1 pitrilysin family protein [Nodularia spumigena CH309]MEA5610194.1 pitrilysin family protein [Nodularia spumigena UHCC 0060]